MLVPTPQEVIFAFWFFKLLIRYSSRSLEAEITAMEDEIKQTMGEEEILLAGSYKVLWKPVTTSRFDSVRFKKEHAELAEAYTKTTTTRRFTIN